MKNLSINELKNIKGGTTVSATLIKIIVNTIENVLDAGRNMGSSLRRLFSNNMCPLN